VEQTTVTGRGSGADYYSHSFMSHALHVSIAPEGYFILKRALRVC
jgi:hypothetical protein